MFDQEPWLRGFKAIAEYEKERKQMEGCLLRSLQILGVILLLAAAGLGVWWLCF